MVLVMGHKHTTVSLMQEDIKLLAKIMKKIGVKVSVTYVFRIALKSLARELNI